MKKSGAQILKDELEKLLDGMWIDYNTYSWRHRIKLIWSIILGGRVRYIKPIVVIHPDK